MERVASRRTFYNSFNPSTSASMASTQERKKTQTTLVDDVDESTPLIPQKRTPLPKLQMFIVFLIQFAEPVTATVIYPFVNQFVRSTGITGGDEKKTGYYAGMIESVFFLAEAITVFHWARLSDYFGRKPVLLLGPLGLGFSMMMFGLSKTFWMLVFARFLQGAFNGNIGVSRTVIVEMSDETNLADALALIPLMWSSGTTLGPIIGGVLSDPAERWPSTLGKLAFFIDHPYFLPCAAAALIAFVTALISAVSLKETMPSIIRRRKGKASSQSSSGSTTPRAGEQPVSSYGSTGPSLETEIESILEEQGGEVQKEDQKPPAFRELMIPQVLRPLQVYGFLAFIDTCSAVLMPLVLSTSTALGGAGFDAYRIGTIMGIYGLVNAILQGTLLGPVIRWVGPTRMLLVSFASYFTVLGLYPVLGYFARSAGYADARVWAVIIIQLICMVTNNAAYVASQIILVDNTPSRAALGSINGMSQAVASGLRSVAPSFASPLFSISLEKHLAGGNAVYYILMAMILWGIKNVIALPKYLISHGRK